MQRIVGGNKYPLHLNLLRIFLSMFSILQTLTFKLTMADYIPPLLYEHPESFTDTNYALSIYVVKFCFSISTLF